MVEAGKVIKHRGLRALLATLGLAAIAYFSLDAAGVSLPQRQREARQEGQISSSPKKTIDDLAVIRQYQPELAHVIEQQPWYKDGINKDKAGEKHIISLFNLNLPYPNVKYLPDKVMLDSYERDIAMVYPKGFESTAQESAAYLKNNLPKIQSFFGIPVSWSMLVVHLREASKSAGGSSKDGIALINAAYPDLPTTERLRHTMGHEGGHTILNQDDKGGVLWYNESMADLGYHVAEGNLDNLLSNLEKKRWSDRPLADFTLRDHRRTGEHVDRGMELLLKYREIVGHDGFRNFANDVNRLKQTRELNDRDIREKMLLYTPEPSKANVAAMYDVAVYGGNK